MARNIGKFKLKVVISTKKYYNKSTLISKEKERGAFRKAFG